MENDYILYFFDPSLSTVFGIFRLGGAYTNQGRIFAKKKKWKNAIALYKDAIHITPDLGPAHINIAVAYYVQKDYKSSWKHSRVAEKLGIPQARILIKKLREISKEPQ